MKDLLSEDQVKTCLEILDETFPDAGTELEYESDLDLLIATILSAQCTDVRVNKVTRELFKELREPEDYIDLGLEELKKRIKSCGFYNNKAKNIIGACQMIVDDFDGQVPQTREDLMMLPGVGRKTANVVASTLFGLDAIAVDTHVHRTANRLGLADSSNVKDTEKDLMAILPKDQWTKTHHRLIFLGRRICKSRRPLCEECPLNGICYFNTGQGKWQGQGK